MKTSQSQPPKGGLRLKQHDYPIKSSIASYYQDLNTKSYSAEVDEELNALEEKVKRGKDINRKWLQEKMKIAHDFSEQTNDKMEKARSLREQHNLDLMNNVVQRRVKKEQGIDRMKRHKKEDLRNQNEKR